MSTRSVCDASNDDESDAHSAWASAKAAESRAAHAAVASRSTAMPSACNLSAVMLINHDNKQLTMRSAQKVQNWHANAHTHCNIG